MKKKRLMCDANKLCVDFYCVFIGFSKGFRVQSVIVEFQKCQTSHSLKPVTQTKWLQDDSEQLPDSAFVWYVSVIRYETGFIKSRSLQRSANKHQT